MTVRSRGVLNLGKRFFGGNGLIRNDKFDRAKKEDQREIEKAIFKNTEISQDHLTPELKLHLLTPNCPLYHAAAEASQSTDANQSREKKMFQDPFWSIYWPGGQVLTRFILDMGIKLLSDKFGENSRVLDLGSGCGASAIAAKLVGAREVLANDIDDVACVAILMNAKLNNVDLQVSKENLIEGTVNELFNVILIGDLLYDEEIAEKLIPWLERSSRNGSRIYLGDPGRHGLTHDLKKKMTPIYKYDLPENVKRENHGFDSATVWRFVPN